MLPNILEFVKKLLPTINKSDVLSDFETSLEAIDELQSLYSDLASYLDKNTIKSKEAKKVIDEFLAELYKSKDLPKINKRENFARVVLTLLENIKLNAKFLYDELDNNLSESTVTGSLEAKRANLLRSVAHYRFMTKMLTDLLNYIYTNEMSEENKHLAEEGKLNPHQVKELLNNLWILAKCVAGYAEDSDKFKAKVEKLSQVQLSKEENETIEALYSHSDDIDLIQGLPHNFIGSPIYTIRLVFAQWQAQRYHEMKDKKKLLELRLQYLRQLKEKGEADINLEKEIEYLQNRITKLDYKLAKIEESANV